MDQACAKSARMPKSIYLDHNATTPIFPELKGKVREWLDFWGNPSSIHWAGRGPKAVLREARRNLADLLGVEPLELIFTSGGSESNNLAFNILDAHRGLGRDQVIISRVEHPSVAKTAEYWSTRGWKVDQVSIDRNGELNFEEFESLLSERTALVSIMTANNETGHIFPIQKIAELAHARGALVHTDAVQTLGKIAVNLHELGVDLASFSGHKFYSLKGTGLLYVRKGVSLTSLIHGGGQERGRRAGTENLLSIAALGFMASKKADIAAQGERIKKLRDHFEARVLSEIEGSHVTGAEGLRLPNTSSVILPGVDGETLLMNLDVRGFAVSTGAACSSGNPEPSPTLLAMGLSREEAQSSLRVSFGWENTTEDIDAFVEALKSVVERLRGFRHGERFAYGV